MKEESIIFERNMEVAEIGSTTKEKGGKQSKEVEIMLRGKECLLALRRFGVATTHIIADEEVKGTITRYK